MFLHVVISLRLPMVFNSSFMPGAFYKLYSHGLLARPPTEPACLNSICLHPRHIEWVKNGSSPAFFSPLPPFLPSCKARVGVKKGAVCAALDLVGLGFSSCTPDAVSPPGFVWRAVQDLHPSTPALVLPNLSIASRCIISDGSLFKLNPKCIT